MNTKSEREVGPSDAGREEASNPFIPAVGIPMTAADIAAGLQRMADFLDPGLAARKVAMDHAFSRHHLERTDDNG